MELFAFGLGYTVLTLADRLRAAGWSVAGTCRSAEKAEALRERGVAARVWDGADPLPDLEAALAGARRVLSSIPPGEAGDPVLAHHAADLRRLAGDLRWVGYLSSTGVYGDHDGAWVDEEAATAPTSPRGRRRLAAEEGWRALAAEGVPVHVFRLAGIYGPGRSALERVRAGRARRYEAPGVVFSRIHVADAAAALEASLAKPRPGAVYNVADDEPAAQPEVVAHACALLGEEPPPLEPLAEAQVSPGLRAFFADRKRVDNARLKRELGLELAYPTYREGLASLFRTPGGR